LLGFAARISSKRKYLLVSKILGKHYPVKPRIMTWSYRKLAQDVLKNDNCRRSLWIGMAETATGLGYGVFEKACQGGVQQALFMQTTRYHLEGVPRLDFEESHSHASDFFLYYPENADQQERFLKAETLILIDDEISTGLTFLRLIKAFQKINPHLRKVFIVSLVNFAHADDRKFLEAQVKIPVAWVFIRQGSLHFQDSRNDAIDQLTVNVSGNGACKKHLLAWPGRTGITEPIQLEQGVLQKLMPHFNKTDDVRPILVLGSGECIAPAYLLGQLLENNGHQVKVQSTTRSPIHQGNDIQSICRFEDNYQDGIPNFLYNMNPGDYREIILCHETPLCQAITGRLTEWQAISARFELCPGTSNAKLHFFRP
jgi:hypothetical protein